MKVYWRNLVWNYTGRLWSLWKYRNSRWKSFYCAKRIITHKQLDKLSKRMKVLIKRDIPIDRNYVEYCNSFKYRGFMCYYKDRLEE